MCRLKIFAGWSDNRPIGIAILEHLDGTQTCAGLRRDAILAVYYVAGYHETRDNTVSISKNSYIRDLRIRVSLLDIVVTHL